MIHNHWWEYARLNGKLIADMMIELLDPAVLFELDTYWIKVGGSDPARTGANTWANAPRLLHIKDGPGEREAAQDRDRGGIMDFPAILKAGGVQYRMVDYGSRPGGRRRARSCSKKLSLYERFAQMKKALLVWGGWDGHEPKQCTDIFAPILERRRLSMSKSATRSTPI